MREISMMNPSKETDNKLRWHSADAASIFKLYIPKWRVPEPWPVCLKVTLAESERPPGRSGVLQSKASSEEPIIAIVTRMIEHTETVRFTPIGDSQHWEIGEPYVPYALLPNANATVLEIKVEWDRSAGTWQ